MYKNINIGLIEKENAARMLKAFDTNEYDS